MASVAHFEVIIFFVQSSVTKLPDVCKVHLLRNFYTVDKKLSGQSS